MRQLLPFALFYSLGLLHFIALLPDAPTDLMRIDDWRYAHYYYSVWQKALVQGVFPFQVSPILQPTPHFWAIPETIFSPQLALLPFVSLANFACFNMLFQYTLGFVGTYMLRRYWDWSLPVWAIFALLYHFNGFAVAHLAVGHFAIWGGYCLLPWVIYFLCRILESTSPCYDNRAVLGLAGILVAIYCQGAFHVYLWCAWLLVIIALFRHEYRYQLAQALLWSIALLAFRLSPTLWAFKDQTSFQFVGGFPTLSHWWAGLTQVQPFEQPAISTYFGHLGWWELDLYIDLSGALFLLVFLVIPLRAWVAILLSSDTAGEALTCQARIARMFDLLRFPLLVFSLLSFSYCYGAIAKLPIPLLHSERVSTRFFSVALVWAMVLASGHCQVLLTRLQHTRYRQAAYGLLGIWGIVIAVSLLHHSLVWRINHIAAFYPDAPAPTAYQIVPPDDYIYIYFAWTGIGISIFAAAIYIARWRRARVHY